MTKLSVILVLTALIPATARAAAPGTPDTSFAGDGVSRIVFPGEFAEGQALVPTPGPLAVVGDFDTTNATAGGTFVTGLTANGQSATGFGTSTTWPAAAPFVVGAVREASGRIVVARGGTPGNVYPTRTELVGYTATGQLDPTFGTGGRRLLSSAGSPVRILLSPTGTLLVVGSGGGTATTPDTDVVLTRVSAAGTELGHANIPLPSATTGLNVSAATVDGSGGVIVAGTNPAAYLVRFTPAGAPDASYGTVRPALGNVQVDDLATDATGRLLLAGATIGDFGRSVGVPLRPLLVRLSAAGVLDSTFAAIGRGAGSRQSEFTGVRAGGAGRIYVSVPSGEVMRFNGTGRPDQSFGDAGVSPLPPTQLNSMGSLTLAAPNVLVTGAGKFGGNQTPLVVERVRVTGSGVPPARRHYSVQVRRLKKIVAVRPAVGTGDQGLTGAVGALLNGRHISGGDGFFFTPPAVEVTARRGTARVTGVGGRADVRGGRFTLRDAPKGKVAELALFGARCGHPETATINMRGPFRLRTGGLLIANRSHLAKVRLGLRCGHRTTVLVLSGSVRVVG